MRSFFSPVFLLLTLFSLPAAAQWEAHNSSNSTIPAGAFVQHVASDWVTGSVYVMTFDTSMHLHSFSRDGGWVSNSEFDYQLDTILGIRAMKVRNNKLWLFSAFGLKKFENGELTHIPFPAGFSVSNGGFYADQLGNVWVAAGPGSGISRFDGQNWKSYNKLNYPSFEQDYFINDLQVDEAKQVVWVATNCHLASGVYKIDIAADKITRYHYGEAKYQCAHAAAPGRTRTFVGTCNFSSIRIMDAAGQYVQSLDEPKAGCVARIEADPADRDRAWVLDDKKLMLFSDTNSYLVFDKDNSPLAGFGNDMAFERTALDTLCLWVATSKGLFSYKYDVKLTTGLKPLLAPESVSLSPNPVSAQLTINILSGYEALTGEIADLTGKRKYSFKTEANGIKQVIDVSELTQGIYLLKLSGSTGTVIKKFVKSH